MKTCSIFDEYPDDIDELPEETIDETEVETTEDLTEESFYRFKDSLPTGNDWDE